LIEIVGETGSTSADLLSRLSAGEAIAEGYWLVADRQTAGRGRQGRVWNDGNGNFMGSTLVRLRSEDPAAHTLSLVAGVAAHAAVASAAPSLAGLALKWPNDLLVGQAKLAGILLERSGDVVVVGIGVNLARTPDVSGRMVTSLADCGRAVPRDHFAAALEDAWADALRLWHEGCWDQLRGEWIAHAHPSGTPLRVHGPEGEMLQGSFAGLDSDGALQLQLAGGTRRTIHAGEVLLDTRR
jgi:BirA family biotin operon repressor/biotin-[acetyl-CoA-carboxylase] ligase